MNLLKGSRHEKRDSTIKIAMYRCLFS